MSVARKTIRVIGPVEESDIKNEIRAVEKLCYLDKGNVLVQIFHHQKGTTGIEHDLHQIDMELCLRSLREHIKAQNTSIREIVAHITDGKGRGIVTQLRLARKLFSITIILSQILEGLEFIHSRKEVHRDLKPENSYRPLTKFLMLVLFSYIHQRWKIADFGAAAEGSSKKLLVTSNCRGTDLYRAPEVIEHGKYNRKSDIWAFGCTAYELFTKDKAFKGDWETMFYEKVEDSSPKRVSCNWPPGDAVELAKDLSKICVDDTLRVQWKDRPSVTEIRNVI